MSVIAMVLAARAYDIADYQTRAEDLLRQCQLSDRRDNACAAHIHNAKAILFDEPLTGLDPHAIRTMKASIRERAAAGAGFIVSSHLLSLIDDLCTHLLVLHQGQALFTGTVDDARAVASQSAKTATLEESFFHIVRGAVES